jgi:glycosyltransferase involved in cell wall biosynthesis
MNNQPRVSVVISFLNSQRFLTEAIESVFAQTFKSWELLLVDDGSSDSSSQIARRYSLEHPHLVKYLEHHHHRNRGQAASRNLGLRNARAEFIAVLDSDDVWLPGKLEHQVAVLDSHPEVAMVSGSTEYWRSWDTQSPEQQADYVQTPGVPAGRIYEPPTLLKFMLAGKAFAPCPSDLLFRKESISNLGGFEDSFIGFFSIYEDTAFLVKVYSNLPVFLSDQCLDRYRLHSDSVCARVKRTRQYQTATAFYLNWVGEYLSSQGVMDAEIKDMIRRHLWPHHHPLLYRLRQLGPSLIRRLKRLGKGLHHG